MTDIKQFKLSSCEEIICEVMEWPDFENNEIDLVVRNVYKIVTIEQSLGGDKYYTFKPWMSFQDEDDMFQTINSGHIVAEANPSQRLLEHYFIAVKGVSAADAEESRKEVQKKLEEYINGLRSMVENRLSDTVDSDGPNVIKFPGRTLH